MTSFCSLTKSGWAREFYRRKITAEKATTQPCEP